MIDLASISWKTHKYDLKMVEGVPPLFPRYEKKGRKTPCIAAVGSGAWRSVNPFDFYRPSEGGKRCRGWASLDVFALESTRERTTPLVGKGHHKVCRALRVVGLVRDRILAGAGGKAR